MSWRSIIQNTARTFLLVTSIAVMGFASVDTPAPSSTQELWDGEDYSRNAILQYEWAKKFFFDHHALKSDAKVLDIGCGNGINTAKIAALTPQGQVIGIDKSPSMVTKARQNSPKYPHLSFQEKDATDMAFYEGHRDYFDVVVSLVTLHWIADQPTVLKGIFTTLKPNGVAYLRLCSKGGDPIQDIADKLSQTAEWRQHFASFIDPMNRFSVAEYEKLLHQQGFSIVKIDDVEDKDRLDNIMALKQQLKSWLPHYHHLAKQKTALAEAFLAAIVSMYMQDHPVQDDGSITLYDHYLEVIAQKTIPDATSPGLDSH